MNNTNGRIARQSRQKLMRALLSVMKQYDYEEITVTQIAQEAQLSRKTFYRLFSGKDELLSLFFEEQFQACFGCVQAQNLRHYWDVVQVFFDFWEERREILSLLQKSGLLPRLLEQSYRYALPVFEFVRSKEVASSLSRPLPYLLAYSIGGMHGMLFKWAESGMDIPSTELISALKAGFMSRDL